MTLARGDWFFIVLVMLCALFMSRPYVYAIQQDNYKLSEVFKNKKLKFLFFIDVACITVFVSIWAVCYFVSSRIFWGFLISMFFFITEFALYFVEDLPEKKKPFRYTKRAVRALLSVTAAAGAAMVAAISLINIHLSDVYLRYLLFFAFPLIFPIIFLLSMCFVNVFEKLNNLRYEFKAARILSSDDKLIKIGITGSYGKTSVKNYLAEMLKSDYNVLVTPASYNTPMGIAKTVRGLDATHEVFIAEMGARHTGDIKKLMRIVRPKFTILTAINKQHLQTFRTEENIAKEKIQVVNMAESGGFSVVTDKQRARFDGKIAKHQTSVPIFAGFDPASDVIVRNYRVSTEGSSFDIILGGIEYEAETMLLGAHNAENIALAAAMAYGLGVSAEKILRAISTLQATPHRLQLIDGKGIKIIDDSFNANPDSARAALEVLKLFKCRKIVMTPGMVELGAGEEEENFKLGEEIAEVADVVLLIGKSRAEIIKKGLIKSNFNGEIHRFNSLCEAEEAFCNLLHVNDILLILNDLPDNYNE